MLVFGSLASAQPEPGESAESQSGKVAERGTDGHLLDLLRQVADADVNMEMKVCTWIQDAVRCVNSAWTKCLLS